MADVRRNDAGKPVRRKAAVENAVKGPKVLATLEPAERDHLARLFNAMEAAKLTALAHAHLYDVFTDQLAETHDLPSAWDIDFQTGEIKERING